MGADIVKRALSYPLKLIAKNAGVNGSVVSEKVYLTLPMSNSGTVSGLELPAAKIISFSVRCCQLTILNLDTMLQLEIMKI